MREDILRDIGTERRVPIGEADRYIDAVPLFLLNYRDPDGPACRRGGPRIIGAHSGPHESRGAWT
jgi:hypothetical protein